ncbi:MAG: aminopeptidase P family protein [Treponema sp.]|jgi:Xaa-Pro aminopeptidase|nr:aminopeptidase P family protein [Treponema sp.]
MTKQELYVMQKAIRDEELDGWLFCNFHHRDTLSDAILGLPADSTNSRIWVYAVSASVEPLKIIHAIETSILDKVPGRVIVYQSREEFIAALKGLAGARWGVHVSDTLPAISLLDVGLAHTFESGGLSLCSAAGLVQRFKGLLGAEGIASHKRAARHLYDIVALAWERVKEAHTLHQSLCEGDIRGLFLDEMHRRGLITDHSPIVGAGVNSGNPHYDFSGAGATFVEGDVIQFDLWAKEVAPAAIYADISWVGIFAREVPPRVEQVFTDLVSAREEVYRFIAERRTLSGADVDRKMRELLIGMGYASALKHRTGHGIDTEVHGSGVNMDSVEFPDSRPLLEGSCFSLEPGLYFAEFGLRTEIDVYIKNGKPVVSGKDRQFNILIC